MSKSNLCSPSVLNNCNLCPRLDKRIVEPSVWELVGQALAQLIYQKVQALEILADG